MEKKELELQKILSIIKDYCDLEELTNESFYDKVAYYFDYKYNGSFAWDKGVTKGVLIFRKLGFVLKFPFVGYVEEEDEECYGEEISYFNNADTLDGWDYCSAEVNRYQEAKKAGIENLFLEIKQIDKIDGYPIYYQEYAIPYSEGTSSSNESQRHIANNLCKIKKVAMFINREWLGDIINVFSINTLEKFLIFIKDFDIDDDLHIGNIGYQGDRPIVIDYGSYND